MRTNKIILFIAALVMVLMIALISIMSVRSIPEGGRSGMMFFSFGGKAELRNTIEIPLSEVESLRLEYSSKNIKVYPSGEDRVIIKEYLYNDTPEAMASVSYGDEKEVLVSGKDAYTFVIFGFFWGEGERIEVYLPEKGLKTLSIETGSGNITSDSGYIANEESLTVKAGSGNINWSNAAAKELSFRAGSGNIKVKNVGGVIEMQTGSGNITGEQVAGKLKARAGSGNITLEEFEGSGSAEAGSGNVRMEAVSVTGDMEFETRSGNIRVEVPEGLSFQFQADTGSGNINTDFDDVLSYNKKGNSAEGNVGLRPELRIYAKAGSGNVRFITE